MDYDAEIKRLQNRIITLKAKKIEDSLKPLPFVKRINNLGKWAYVNNCFDPHTGEVWKNWEYTTISHISQLVDIVSEKTTLTQRKPAYNCPIYFDSSEEKVPKKDLSEEDKNHLAHMAEEIIEILYKYKVEYNKRVGSPKFIRLEDREAK